MLAAVPIWLASKLFWLARTPLSLPGRLLAARTPFWLASIPFWLPCYSGRPKLYSGVYWLTSMPLWLVKHIVADQSTILAGHDGRLIGRHTTLAAQDTILVGDLARTLF